MMSLLPREIWNPCEYIHYIQYLPDLHQGSCQASRSDDSTLTGSFLQELSSSFQSFLNLHTCPKEIVQPQHFSTAPHQVRNT